MAGEDRLIRDEESLRFFFGLSNRDQNARILSLENISSTFDGWIEGYGSPKDYVLENHRHDDLGAEGSLFKHLIVDQMPDILRLSLVCPFREARERCASLLQDLQERGMKIPRRRGDGSSAYIPCQEVVPVDTEDDETHDLFVDAFLQNNRLEHMTQVMGYHPKYLDVFLRTQHYMLRGNGPLPYNYRHYIALMAAGRHQCSYLINLQTTEFILQGGDEKWLKGLDHIPQKLRDLYELNKIMAHRPWLLNKSHIEKLTKGKDNWSLSELMHAIVLLAHFHALSSFVYGCGVNAEIEHENGHTFSPTSVCEVLSSESNHSSPNSHQGTPNSSAEGESGIEALMLKMKQLTEATEEEPSPEEIIKRFEKIESQSAELPAALEQPSPKADILRYVDDADFHYQDFAKRGNPEIPTFRAQDYSWEEQGFSLINRLYSDIGNLLDEKFRIASSLTYYTMGDNRDVDTTSFRMAIWNYIHCMFGIRHDDYDYGEVNQLLERSLKAYIKTVTCYPERITKKDYDAFMREFKHSEKVHVNLMLLEARMQAELLYALRAIMKYMT